MNTDQIIDKHIKDVKKTHSLLFLIAVAMLIPMAALSIAKLSPIIIELEQKQMVMTFLYIFLLIEIPLAFYLYKKKHEEVIKIDDFDKKAETHLQAFRIKLFLLLSTMISLDIFYFLTIEYNIFIFSVCVLILIFISKPSQLQIEKLFYPEEEQGINNEESKDEQ